MENKIGEAPASATVKIKSKNGFEYLFTLREMTGTALLNKMESLELDLLSRGYSALSQSFSKFPQKADLPTKDCPFHHQPMKDPKGKGFYHSRGVYPDMEYCNGSGFSDGT